MSDQTFRNTIVVEDQGSDPIDQYRQSWIAAKGAMEDAAKGADLVSASISSAESDITSSRDLVNDLAQSIRDFVAAGNDIAGYSIPFRELSAAGYDVNTVMAATDEALRLVEGGAADASSAMDSAVPVTREYGDALQTIAEGMQEIADSGPGTADAIGGMTDQMQQGADASGNASDAGGGLANTYGNIGTAATISGGRLAGLKNVAQEFTQKVGVAGIAGGGFALTLFKIGEAAAAEEPGIVSMNKALANSVPGWDGDTAAIERNIAARQKYGYDDSELRASFASTVRLTHDIGQAFAVQSVAMDLARAKNMDLESATQLLIRGMLTGGSAFRKMGIDIKQGATETEVLRAVQAKFAGEANTYSKTTAASFDRLKTSIGNLAEALGGPVSGAGEKALGGLDVLAQGATIGVEGLGKALDDLFHGRGIDDSEMREKFHNLQVDIGTVPATAEDAAERLDESARQLAASFGVTVADHKDLVDQYVAATGDALDREDSYMAQHLANVQTTQASIKEALDITDAAAAAAKSSGSAYYNDLNTQLKNTEEITRGHVWNIKTILGTVWADIMAVNAAMGAATAKATAMGGYVPGTGTVNVGIAKKVSGWTPPAYTSPADQKRQYDYEKSYIADFEKKYGYNPLTGAPPPKASGGGGAGGSRKTGSAGSTSAAASQKAATEAADLAAARARYVQDQAQLALENQLSDAEDATTAARDHKKAVDESYGNVLDALNDKLAANAQAEQATIAPLEATAQAEQQALDDMRARNEAALHGIDVAIHDTTESLKAMEAVVAGLEAPFEAALASAQRAQAALGKEIAGANEAFQDQKDAISDEQRAFEEQATLLMGPYNAAYDAAQERVQGLQDQLTELSQQEASDDRQKVLANQAQEVGNYTARLANLRVGSKAYNSVLKEQADAERALQRGEKVDSLTKQKEAAELAVTAAQKARDEEAKLLEGQRAVLAERMAAVDREQELYNRQARDKQQFAQQDVDNAQAALDAQKARDAAMEASTKARLAQLQSERDTMVYNAQEAERTEGLIVAAKNKAVEDAKTPFEAEKTRIGEMVTSVQGQKKAQDELNDSIIKGAEVNQNAIKVQLDLFRDNEKSAKIASDWANAQDKYATATAKAALETSNTAKAINTELVPAIAGMTTSAQPSVDKFWALWTSYFGTPSQEQVGKITNLMATHNPTGFWTYVESQAHLALGEAGVTGAILQELNTMFTRMAEKFVEERASIAQTLYETGVYIIDGITQGVEDGAAEGRLAAAITKAIDDALADAQNKQEVGSPSEKWARELGVPLIMGVAKGIDDGASLVASSARAATDPRSVRSLSGIGGGSGGGGNIGTINLNLAFPNVTDATGLRAVLTDRSFLRGAVIRTFREEAAYDASRAGEPRLATVPRR